MLHRLDEPIAYVPSPPSDFPEAPSGAFGVFDLHYYWDFFVSQPLSFKVGLICLAALLYHAIRLQMRRDEP